MSWMWGLSYERISRRFGLHLGENETSKDFEDISESSDDNTNVVNATREPFIVNQDPGVKSSQDPPQIDQNWQRIFKPSKKEQALQKKYRCTARHHMLSIPFVDEDDYIPLGDIIARYSTSKFRGGKLEEQEEKSLILKTLQIKIVLREKLLNVHRLISKIESLKDNPTPDRVLESPSPFPIPVADSDSFLEESDTSLSHLDNSLPEFETFSDHTKETRSGSTTTHANYSLPEYDSFLFEIEPDQEGLISIDNSNEPLMELPEFESFHFNPSFPRPPPEPPDVCMRFKPILAMKNDFVKSNEDFYLSETVLPLNVEDVDSFTFIIRTFLPYFTYPENSPLIFSFRSENFVFDSGIVTFHQPVACSMKVFHLLSLRTN
ncbi:hypothetical protein Tco_0717120 [Tanacetum coccineum]